MKDFEPKVTVITITYNIIEAGRKEAFLKCVESVKSQDYADIEHIIIDGASKDGTLELIQATGINYFSEPDNGIYDAMNKGINKASGKYIAFLNSDDYWHDPKGVQESVNALEAYEADFSYAPFTLIDEKGNIIETREPELGTFLYQMPFCHQTMFTKTNYLRTIGKFNSELYKSAGDYDIVLRLILNGAKAVLVKNNFTSYRNVGLSSTNQEQSIKEASLALERNLSKFANSSIDYKKMFTKKIIPVKLVDKVKEVVDIHIVNEVQKEYTSSNQSGSEYFAYWTSLESYFLFSIEENSLQKNIKFLGFPLLKIRRDKKYKRYFLFGIFRIYKSVLK